MVSISGKHRFRRLHKLGGGCNRVPGLDYKDFEELGAEMPDASSYDDWCGKCWPTRPKLVKEQAQAAAALGVIDADGTDSSGDESSSTEEG